MPAGVHGSRPKIGAPDAIWHASLRLEDLRNQGTSAAAVTLDQEKFFDRLLLPALEHFAAEAGLDGIFLKPLAHYARIERFLFLDGGPTGHILRGENACGIPQGCPHRAFLC